MPQMSPMSWIFILMIVILLILIFFNYSISNSATKEKLKGIYKKYKKNKW